MAEDKDFKISLEINQNQARVIQDALELYSRLQMGQLKEIDLFFRMRSKEKIDANGHVVVNLLNILKKVYFPGLEPNAYHGIFGDKTPEEAKIAWDLIQNMRYTISWKIHPEGGMGVNFDPPMQSSNEEFPKVKIIPEYA